MSVERSFQLWKLLEYYMEDLRPSEETIGLISSTRFFSGFILTLAALAFGWGVTEYNHRLKLRDGGNNIDSTKEGTKVATKPKKVEEKIKTVPEKRFEISPDDECEFVPLVSEEEDRRIAQQLAPPTKYIPLDPANPGGQINSYLNSLHVTEVSSSESDEDERNDFSDKVKEFKQSNHGLFISPEDLEVVDDPTDSASECESVISSVKKARLRTIRNELEKNMTTEDHIKERMITSQTLSKVYAMMKDNQEMFGDVSFEQVKSQMNMYKA